MFVMPSAKIKRCARLVCANRFVPKTKWQKYCSDDCEYTMRQYRYWLKKIGGTI